MNTSDVAEQYASWLSSLVQEALARRNSRLAALKTPADVTAWAEETRQWYRQAVGPLVPLTGEPRRIHCGTIPRDGYRVEKWLLEVFPGTFDPINLYVPDRPNAKGVAIVMPEGHWAEGKAGKDHQNPCAYFAYNGIPTLVYDHSGNGERREYWNRVRNEPIPGKTPTSEHDRTGDLSTLAGIQPVRFYISEAAQDARFPGDLPVRQAGEHRHHRGVRRRDDDTVRGGVPGGPGVCHPGVHHPGRGHGRRG